MVKLPPLGVKFGGEPKDLGIFLLHVSNFVRQADADLPTDEAKIRIVTLALEGTAADWVVSLHNENSPVMRDFETFMTALRRRFEDPLVHRRARLEMKTLHQGRDTVPAYTQKFRQLAIYMRGWSVDALIDNYAEGLHPAIYQGCINRRSPTTLEGWYDLAADVEIDLARNKSLLELERERERKFPPPPMAHDTQRERKGGAHAKPRANVCFRCGKEGHWANQCRMKAKPPIQFPPERRKPTKTPGMRTKQALTGVEPLDLTTAHQQLKGEPDDWETQADSSDENYEPGVSSHSGPMTIPLSISAPSSGRSCETLALVDSGCSRCLISQTLVQQLGFHLKPLKAPIAFCQMDGSVAGGSPALFVTEPIEMKIGHHIEVLHFIVAPIAENPIILGINWLRKWNPVINWKEGWIRIPLPTPPDLDPQTPATPPTNTTTSTPTPLIEGVHMGCATRAIENIPGEEKIPKEYLDLKDVFSESSSNSLPPHRATDCSIDFLPGVQLPKPRIYSMTPGEMAELRKFIDKNLDRGFIEPARPRVAAPVMFREKKDGELRLVVDYRFLNAICAENVYPLPLMKDMLAHLATGKIFTKLDLREAYYRIRIKEGDEWKTAFNCPLGCFQFKVLPFGLQGAPSVFMQLINKVLHQHLYKGVIVYLDDILIYTETREEHVKLVRSVLNKLRAAELYAKLSKCEFHQQKIDYLGYRISADGIEMDPAKVRAVTEWAPPRTRKQLQSFLGFANFYRQFIPSFASIALPITNLLKTKGDNKPKPSSPLRWTMECQAAFEKLKRLFAAEPVLKHPDVDAPFVVQADASDVAVGAVLLQYNKDGHLQPCAYTSRKLSDSERRWAIWEKEAFAVRWALMTWRHFLEGSSHPFEVWTDHKNLEALTTPRKLSPKQVRWSQYFARFNFTLKYIPGGKNFMADALSRLPQYNSSKLTVVQPLVPRFTLAAPVVTRSHSTLDATTPPELLERIKTELLTDEWFTSHSNDCTLRDGVPWIGSKIYVPTTLRPFVLQRAHDSRLAGHFGFVKTMHLVKRQFWWPSLKKDIQSYIASCPVCASSKRSPGKPQGLLQSVARPEAPWKEISMDFIVDLPCSQGYTVIWVVTDLFSKQVHFVPFTKIPSAKILAKAFLTHIYRLHGVPTRIISDRGVQFTSKFWKEFLILIGSTQGLSSSHHPQTNGSCERANSVLEQYLRCFINYQQDDWADLLIHAEVAYNNSVHSSTGMTPFKVIYGQDFVPIPELPHEPPSILSLSEWSQKLSTVWPIIRKTLDEAHQSHKLYADRKRAVPPQYKVGDRVFVSTKFLETPQKCKKLGPKFVGPFTITKIISSVSVKLDLPKSYRRLYPIFHVHLLKPERISDLRPPPFDTPTPVHINGEQHFEVRDILDSRLHRNKIQYLVAWKDFPPSHTEWVDKCHVRAPKLLKQFYAKYPNKP